MRGLARMVKWTPSASPPVSTGAHRTETWYYSQALGGPRPLDETYVGHPTAFWFQPANALRPGGTKTATVSSAHLIASSRFSTHPVDEFKGPTSNQAGQRRRQDFPVYRARTFVFGRMPDCHACIPDDDLVSRHHFILEANPPQACLRDLGSLNGTWVNGKKFGAREKGETPEKGAKRRYPEVALKHGDRITKSDETELEVSIEQPKEAPRHRVEPEVWRHLVAFAGAACRAHLRLTGSSRRKAETPNPRLQDRGGNRSRRIRRCVSREARRTMGRSSRSKSCSHGWMRTTRTSRSSNAKSRSRPSSGTRISSV